MKKSACHMLRGAWCAWCTGAWCVRKQSGKRARASVGAALTHAPTLGKRYFDRPSRGPTVHQPAIFSPKARGGLRRCNTAGNGEISPYRSGFRHFFLARLPARRRLRRAYRRRRRPTTANPNWRDTSNFYCRHTLAAAQHGASFVVDGGVEAHGSRVAAAQQRALKVCACKLRPGA